MKRLFVYGTLRRGAPMHALIEGRVRRLGSAHAPGRLFDLGAFPALVEPESPDDRVRGELYDFDASEQEAVLDVLDRYEGERFQREAALVEGPDGPEEAWLYRYRGDVSGHARFPGDDYLGNADD